MLIIEYQLWVSIEVVQSNGTRATVTLAQSGFLAMTLVGHHQLHKQDSVTSKQNKTKKHQKVAREALLQSNILIMSFQCNLHCYWYKEAFLLNQTCIFMAPLTKIPHDIAQNEVQ